MIPQVERGAIEAQFPQRLSHGQLRPLDQPDERVLFGRRAPHVPLSESEAVTPFFNSRCSSTNSATTCLRQRVLLLGSSRCWAVALKLTEAIDSRGGGCFGAHVGLAVLLVLAAPGITGVTPR